MHKKLIIACLSLFPFYGHTQDLITLHTQEAIRAKVVEVTPLLIKYNLEGTVSPLYTIAKTSVHIIRYGDGRSDTFSLAPEPEPLPEEKRDTIFYGGSRARLIKMTPCSRGEYDAKHYHLHGGKNFAVGFLGGFWGVIAVAAIPPGKPAVDISTPPEIMDDPAYQTCYEDKAKKKNLSSAVTGWVSRAGIVILLLVAGF
jgi:hypothetical protein